jgi:hypothetical protein
VQVGHGPDGLRVGVGLAQGQARHLVATACISGPTASLGRAEDRSNRRLNGQALDVDAAADPNAVELGSLRGSFCYGALDFVWPGSPQRIAGLGPAPPLLSCLYPSRKFVGAGVQPDPLERRPGQHRFVHAGLPSVMDRPHSYQRLGAS